MWEYNNIDELYHYGVLGMRWGKRNPKVDKAKTQYKQSKKEYRKAARLSRVKGLADYGISGIARGTARDKRITKSFVNRENAKLKLKETKIGSKGLDKAKAQKKIDKVYTKAIAKSGLVGSIGDSMSGGKSRIGKSTIAYNRAKALKGKAYADKIQKKAQNRIIGRTAATTLALGSAYVALNVYGKK